MTDLRTAAQQDRKQMTTYTTLNKIRAHGPCAYGLAKLLRHLGKTKADDEPLALAAILQSNGFADALWCLRACDGIDREARLYAVWCARQVQHIMTDRRSLAALDVAEGYANGRATKDELAAARAAAWAAAWAAARAAARAAAEDAAEDAAWAAAEDAAWAAAEAAAGAVAWDAAGAAARAVAEDAAWAAAEAAAWATAGAAARAAQAARFLEVFG